MNEIGTKRAPPSIGHVQYMSVPFPVQSAGTGADLPVDTAVETEGIASVPK